MRLCSSAPSSASAKIGAVTGRHGGTVGLVTITDAPTFQIVGRHLDDDPVADAGTDAKPAHLSGIVGENLVIVVEANPVFAIGQYRCHPAVELENLFFCLSCPLSFTFFVRSNPHPPMARLRRKSG